MSRYAWGAEVMRDAGRTVFKFFFRLEVTGLENIPGPGQRVVLAPNHVSLLDGPLLHTILPAQAGFAVNNQIAQAWWVRPFLSVINAHLLEPTKPLAARAIVNAVKAGETMVIFPEGRITRDGRPDEGLRRRGHDRRQGRRVAGAGAHRGAGALAASAICAPPRPRKSLFPKFKVTFLPPRQLTVDPALKGKARRQAAGLALQDILVDAAVETAPLRSHPVRGAGGGAGRRATRASRR